MRKIIYFATLGFDPEKNQPNLGPLISGLAGFAPQTLEQIHLLIDTDKPSIISSVITQYPYLKGKIHVHLIDAFNYETSLEAILNTFSQYPRDSFNFIVNISGGTKIMTLGAFMGAILIGAQTQYVKESKHASQMPDLIDIKMPQIPIYDMHPLQKAIILILKESSKKGLNQSEVRRQIVEDYAGKTKFGIGIKKQISPQVISYHVDILQSNGILLRDSDDADRRIQILMLTRIGMLIGNLILTEASENK